MWLYSLENSLQAIQPHLSPLIEPVVLERLQTISRFFPDALTFSYGFEYRLHPADSRVDFAIHVTPTERDILAGLHPTIRLAEAFDRHPVWQRIRQFCAEWADPSSELHYQVSDLWLEFDLEASSDLSEVPIPGLFISPNSTLFQQGVPPDYSWIYKRAIPLLYGADRAPALQQNLLNCIQQLPTQVGVFQFGLMFGRSLDAVRLCLTGSPLQMLPYLSQVGWQGSPEEVEQAIASLYPLVDGVILDLDIGEQIYSHIGIEGIFLTRYLACVNGQWQSLLNHLVNQGLCLPETRDHLLQYSGYTIVKPLHQRIYVRGLSHIKLIHQPGQPLVSKLYFGVMHKPLSESPTLSTAMTPVQPVEVGVSGLQQEFQPQNRTIAQGRAAAVAFLLAARDAQGWWTDFHLAAGLSDEWVTGYVATMLANVTDADPNPDVTCAMQTAWTLLQTRQHRTSGLWGFNRFPPGDADSTGWALQLAEALGEANSARAEQAVESLAGHWRSNGGISTYERPEPIRAFIHALPEQSLAGWCGAHVCVSAAIAAVPAFRWRLREYLQKTQTADGSWAAYWWHDPEYATALAAEALAACDPNCEAIAAAVDWAMQRLSPRGFVATRDHEAGSPFATAWCLRLLLLGKPSATLQGAIDLATQWLVEQQQPDGSWEASARLRVPLPDDLNPDRFDQWVYDGRIEGSWGLDQHRVFTTATVLQALARVQSFSGRSVEPSSDSGTEPGSDRELVALA
jgi:Prenyltransferase and squalene oxidase repeat